MSYLRDRMGKILAFVIGLALFAFIIGEVVRSGGQFMKGSANNIGEVNGQEISNEDYQKKLDENVKNMQQQSGQAASPQLTAYAQEMTWNQIISQNILQKEIDKLGLVVGVDETKDMVQGKNLNPQIVQAFGDPKTGQVDRARLNMFLTDLRNAKAGDPRRDQWNAFVEQMIEGRKAQKYSVLVRNGLYVNSLDAKDDYEARNKLVNFKYALLDYTSIADDKAVPTDADYSAYYDAHKGLFKNTQETRTFEYVSFNAAASATDSAAVKTDMDKLAGEFKTSTNDSAFVQINSDTKRPLTYVKKGALEPKLDTVMFNSAVGTVYGPFVSTSGSYEIAKLVDTRIGPDSVKASHILLNPTTEGGVDKAVAKADSLKKLIQGGKSFAELAKTFSVDKGSAEKGGELGTFGRGSMIPVFEDAAFNGHKGDLVVVTSQYGVHLIQINDQKGSAKVVKVAIVDKPIQASNTTQSTAYNKARSFLSNLNGDNFDAEAKKENLQVKSADDVTAMAQSLAGLENARKVVKWAFDADKGTVSDQVFDLENQYVVARLTQIKPQGTLPLDAVKKQIEAAVRNEVKAKQLTAKFESALSGASSIDQVAQKAGVQAVPVQNIVFANPVIPGLAAEYKVVGTIFGSSVNKLSKPVAGERGVYVFSVEGFVNPAPLTNAVREKQQIQQALVQRADNLIFDALKDKANVKDNRAKFL